MTAEDVIKIIQYIPEYITYIYPGYITIYVYYFLRAKKIKDNAQTLLKSILISYIYITLSAGIPCRSVFWANVGYIVLALLIAFISYRITKSNIILKIYNKIGIQTTYYENPIEALAGPQNSAWLIVYLKDDDIAIEGSLGHKELEEGAERYITLEGYTKYSVKQDGTFLHPPICTYVNNLNEKCVIKYDEIKYVEKCDTD